MEVENYIYKDNPLYSTHPLFVSFPLITSLRSVVVGSGRVGAILSVDNIAVLVLVLIKSLLVCSHSTQTHTYI